MVPPSWTLAQASKMAPPPTTSSLENALHLLSAKRFDEAAALLLQVVRHENANPIGWFNLGVAEFSRQRYDRAETSFANVIKLKSPLAPAAQLYRAKAFRRLGREQDARELLEGLQSQRLPNSLQEAVASELERMAQTEDVLESTLDHLQKGQPAEAESALRAIEETHRSVDARLLLALALLRQGKTAEAKIPLAELLRIQSLAASKRQLAVELWSQAKAQGARAPSWLNLDLGVGSTSNAFSDGQSISGVASTTTRFHFSFGSRIINQKSVQAKIGYLLGHTDFSSAPELRTTTHTLQTPLSILSQPYDFVLTPYIQQENWGQTPVQLKTGLSSRVTWGWQEVEIGFALDAFASRALSEDFRYLSGTTHNAKLHFSYSLQTMYMQSYFAFGLDGTQDIVYSDSSSLPLTHRVLGPGLKIIWRPSSTIATFVEVSSLSRTFSQPAAPTGTYRSDRELSGSVKLQYWFRPSFAAFVVGEYTQNESTLGPLDVRDKNFQQTNLLAGLSWEAF